MWKLSVLLVLFLVYPNSNGFNIDTENALYCKHKSSDSYFGYTVALYKKNGEPGMIVGAPQDLYQDSNNATGAVYNCIKGENCTQISLDGFNSQQFDNAWIGGAMDINNEFDNVVSCGHHFKVTHSNGTNMPGICYRFDLFNNLNKKLVPSFAKVKKEWFEHPLSGFSIHFLRKENRNNEFLLGAPTTFTGTGTTITYENFTETHVMGANVFHENNFTGPDWVRLYGYSISSGNFYNDNKWYYAIGSPAQKLVGYLGKVFIVELRNDIQTTKENKISTICGEYFGSALAAGDINNDGFDDLIVGAPFYYTNEKYNVGRIYIYLGGRVALKEPTAVKTVEGAGTGAQFGATIQFLGDVDMDGYGDVAVAAPFEDGCGVVYIHKGNPSGLDRQAVQRIVGSDIRPKMQGFGMSISRPYDVDDNGYPDVVIGAPLSGHAVLLRSNQVLTIINHTIIDILKSREITFKSCVTCNVPKREYNVELKMSVTVNQKFMHELAPTKTFISPYPYKNDETCTKVHIKLKTVDDQHLEPIPVTVTYTLPNDAFLNSEVLSFENDTTLIKDTFYKNSLILNSIQSQTFYVELPSPCDNYGCSSLLNFNQTLSNLTSKNVYVLGTSEDVFLTIYIENSKGIAYRSYVLITIPEWMSLKKPSKCKPEPQSNAVKCTLEKKIKQNDTIVLLLEIHQNKVQLNTSEININTKLVTESQDTNNATNKTLKIQLDLDVDLKLSGESSQALRYSKSNAYKTDFTHSFQIESVGVTKRKMNVTFVLYVPHTMKEGNIQFLSIPSMNATYLDGGRIHCINETAWDFLSTNDQTNQNAFSIDCNSEKFTCSKLSCNFASSFKRLKNAAIFVDFQIDLQLVKDYLKGDQHIVFKTEAQIIGPPNLKQSGELPDQVHIITKLDGEPKKEPDFWIYIVAGLCGLFLLILLVCGLFKGGFFKRTTKEKLENLRNDSAENAGEELELVSYVVDENEDGSNSHNEDNLSQTIQNEDHNNDNQT